MANFITLTDADDGTRRRINVNAIDQYFDAGNTLVLSESGSFRATETPEQIDALLGVTDSADEREIVRWYRYSDAGYATVHWTVNSGGFVLIPEGQTVAAGWWMYECTDCDERGKFDRLHRAKSGASS